MVFVDKWYCLPLIFGIHSQFGSHRFLLFGFFLFFFLFLTVFTMGYFHSMCYTCFFSLSSCCSLRFTAIVRSNVVGKKRVVISWSNFFRSLFLFIEYENWWHNRVSETKKNEIFEMMSNTIFITIYYWWEFEKWNRPFI